MSPVMFPQPHATHLCDGVEGGLGLALPAPGLAEGCAEGCRDAGGEVQVQLRPPGTHRDVPGGLCSHQRAGGSRDTQVGEGCEGPQGRAVLNPGVSPHLQDSPGWWGHSTWLLFPKEN